MRTPIYAKAFLKTFILSAGVLSLAGCTAFSSFSEVEALNDAQAVGNPFSQALAEEYKLFANTELKDMFDYPDSLHFARKGLAAASGEIVLPEPVSDWNLNETALQELGASRGRLILAYDQGGRESAPQIAARAQGKFDCWVEREEENKTGAPIACKEQFMEAIGELEAKVEPPPPPAPEPEDAIIIEEPTAVPLMAFDVDETMPMKAENAMYLVFFNWDSAKIDTSALNVLDAVANETKKSPLGTLNITGHADTSGDRTYNQRLAFKRANMVKDSLVKKGVSANMIQVDAKGEVDPLVPTPDNIREPANRRVSITFGNARIAGR